MRIDQGLVNAQKCLVPIGPYPGGSSPKPGSCRYQTREIRISVIKMCLNTNQDLGYQNVSKYKSGSQLSKCVLLQIRISVIKMCLITNQDLSYQNVSYYKSGSQLSKCV